MACSACQKSSRKKTPTSTQLRAKRNRGTCSKFSWNKSCCLTTRHQRTKPSEPAKSRLIAKIAWCIQRSQIARWETKMSAWTRRFQWLPRGAIHAQLKCASSRNLQVRTLGALHCQHNTLVLLCRKRAATIFKSFSKHSLVLLVIWKHDRVCQDEQTAGEVPNLISSRAV